MIKLQKPLILLVVGFFLFGSLLIMIYYILQNNGEHFFPSKNNKVENNKDFKKILGQNLIVGVPGLEIDKETEEILHYIKPAGIVLYRRNYESESQLKDLIARLQEIADEDTGIPYFIMIDEEPEGAMRLGLLKNIFSLGLPKWNDIENDISILADIGINVELAPLADFPFNDDAFIKRRIPTDNAEDLIAFNNTFIALLGEYDISATLKHFPGMGIFIQDPHQEFLSSDIQQEVFEESLNIFKRGIDQGADFVMTGHALYENIDPHNIATFSPKIVKEILIKQLSFQGIVVADDLSDMPLAIEEIDLVDASVQALQAGHNLIMFSHKLWETKEIFDGVLAKAEDNPELQSIIVNNYQKIIDFKKERFTR